MLKVNTTGFGALAVGFMLTACAGPNGPTSSVPRMEASTEARAVVRKTEGDVVANSKDSELVCTQGRNIGSNFIRRVCRTKSEIEAERGQSQDALRGMQRQSGISKKGT